MKHSGRLKGWATASPASVGLDERVLLKLDKEITSGTYSQMIDSFAVFGCGKKVFEHTYPYVYVKIYGKEAVSINALASLDTSPER